MKESGFGKGFPHAKSEMPLLAVFQRTSMISRSRMMKRVRSEKVFTSTFRPPCIGVLQGISHMAPISQKELSEWIGVDPSDLVSIIDQLEKEKLVTRTRDESDRRRQLLSLTAKGEATTAKLRKIGVEVIDETLAPLNAKEREALREMLERVVTYHAENKEDND